MISGVQLCILQMSLPHLGHWSLSDILPCLNSASTVTVLMQTRFFFDAIQLSRVLFIDSFDILPFFTCGPIACLRVYLFYRSPLLCFFALRLPFLLQLMPLSSFELHRYLTLVSSYYYPPFVLSNLRHYKFLLYVTCPLTLFFELL